MYLQMMAWRGYQCELGGEPSRSIARRGDDDHHFDFTVCVFASALRRDCDTRSM